MDEEKSGSGPLTNAAGKLLRSVREGFPGLSGLFGGGEWKSDLKRFYERTSEQFIEKTEETKRTVRLRMAILDIEHHLNRLYPDIGNMACDLWKAGETPLLDNDELKAKVELVWEYLERRETLRAELKQVVNERRKER